MYEIWRHEEAIRGVDSTHFVSLIGVPARDSRLRTIPLSRCAYARLMLREPTGECCTSMTNRGEKWLTLH